MFKLVYTMGRGCLDIIAINDNIYSYRAGGSAFNVLGHLSKAKFKTYADVIIGDDEAGKIVIQDLKKLGLQVNPIKYTKLNTKRIYQNIIYQHKTFIKSQEAVTCPNCKKRLLHKTVIKFNLEKSLIDKIDVAVFDNLDTATLETAQQLHKLKKDIVLDIGHRGRLRYLTIEQLNMILKLPFTIIQINGKVATFIKKKLQLNSDINLYDKLGCKILIVTYAAEGANVIYKKKQTKIAFKVNNIKDTIGAGAIIAYIKDKRKFIPNLLRESRNLVKQVITNLGATGYLYAKPRKDVFKKENVCLLCGLDNTIKNKTYLLPTIINNISRNLKLARQSNFDENLKQLLKEITGQVLVIGTGASFTTATFISMCLNNYNDQIFAKAIRPNDLYSNRLHLINFIILCSYSGISNDIVVLSKEIKKYNIKTVLITHSLNRDTKYDHILSYGTSSSPKERGFIAVESILIHPYFFVKCFHELDFDITIEQLLTKLKAKKYEIPTISKDRITVDLFYDADSYPMAIDLESKFIEADLGRLMMHEKKDVSHGRYVTVRNNKSDLIIYLNYSNTKYQQKLLQYLIDSGYQNIIKIESLNKNKMVKLYEMLIENQFVFNYLGTVMNRDLAAPKYDDTYTTLYKYKGDIR